MRLPILAALGLTCAAHLAAADRPNVLFIAVDDLRPELACYGNTQVKTPNIDRLAARSTVFTQAYCQQAVCSPSRTSLLTGLRPDTTKVYDLVTHFRDTVPDAVTLPQHFKENGWTVEGYGKIFHMSLDDKKSWSTPWKHPKTTEYQLAANNEQLAKKAKGDGKGDGKGKGKAGGDGGKGPSVESAEAAGEGYKDGVIATDAIAAMQRLAPAAEPFFLAVGLTKPHLPFVAPKPYFDLYDSLQYAAVPDAMPKGASQLLGSDWGELRAYSDIPQAGPISPEQAAQLRQGYYACVSFMDAQVGRVLDALDKTGEAGNTIVVLWGDHGFKLGEFGQWCKHTNFEIDVRVPLIVSAPGIAPGTSAGLVEFVDVYPTLAEAAGLPAVAAVEGTSMLPLMREPAKPWKKAAFSQYPRNGAMGYSMRSDGWRYTEWKDRKTGAVRERELYQVAPGGLETENLAASPDQAQRVQALSALLSAGWKGALP